MKIEQHFVNHVPVLELSGRFDALTSEHLEESLSAVISDGASHICLTCREVEFMSSSALRVLLAGLKKVKRNQGSIVLAALPDHIKEVFELAGFLELFVVHETYESAIKSIEHQNL